MRNRVLVSSHPFMGKTIRFRKEWVTFFRLQRSHYTSIRCLGCRNNLISSSWWTFGNFCRIDLHFRQFQWFFRGLWDRHIWKWVFIKSESSQRLVVAGLKRWQTNDRIFKLLLGWFTLPTWSLYFFQSKFPARSKVHNSTFRDWR